MNAQQNYDTRAGELLAWEAETGRTLPATVAEILALEDAGHVVDLETGAVLSSVTVAPTVIGEALAVVLAAETAVQ